MAKYVVFSFDDGRLDTYTKAYPILKKYNMPFTLNVCTDFVEHPEKYHCFQSADNKSVEKDHLVQMQQNGVEIACHGHSHLNTKKDVLDNIAALREMKVDVSKIGFASPNSEITEKNDCGLGELVQQGVIRYIRSGVQIRREGIIYAVLSVIGRITRSKKLFLFLNRRNIIREQRGVLLPSVAITRYNTVEQIRHLIDAMKDGEAVILMFHSILHETDPGYGADNWFFDAEKFDELCEMLNCTDVTVCTTQFLFQERGL